MPKDVTPATLRDTLFIWIFATANRKTLLGIANGTTSGDDLRKLLESQGNIRLGNQDNILTCNSVCAAIAANADEFTLIIQPALVGIPVLAGSWSGSDIHPRAEELQNAFIEMPDAQRTLSKKTGVLKRVQIKSSGRKRTAKRGGRK